MTHANKKDIVLIVSTGQQDLKRLYRDRVGNTLYFDRINRRQDHENLLDGKTRYKICHTEKKLREVAGNSSGLNIEWTKRVPKNPQPLDVAGAWVIYPAKLAPVVQALKGHFNVVGALVFYSKRRKLTSHEESRTDPERKGELSRDYDNEPIATGPIIKNWLAETFGSDKNDPNFICVNYLKDSIALEGESVLTGGYSAYEQPCSLRATHIIEDAMKSMGERFPGHTAVLSQTGGFGDIKPVISAAASLYFGGNVLELNDNKYSAFTGKMLNHPTQFLIPSRNAVLDARHQAAQRLWEGDFAGAWAVTAHMPQGDPQLSCDKEWVEKIREAANFMQGWRPYDTKAIDSLKGIPEGVKRLFVMAWRVEAALQNNRGEALITDVLRHLGTFRENLLAYLLLKILAREESNTVDIDLNNWTINIPSGNKSKIRENKYKKKDDSYDYYIQAQNGYLKTFSMQRLEEYLEKIYKDTAEYKAYHPFRVFLERDIEKACVDYKSEGKRKCLRFYRNQLMHTQLDTETIEQITCFGNQTGLWSTKPNQQQIGRLGQCFLGTSMIKNLFKVLGTGIAPDSAYRSFSSELFEALHNPVSPRCAS